MIRVLIVACLLFVSSAHAATTVELTEAMNALKEPTKQRIQEHILSLSSYIKANKVDEYGPFTKLIDGTGDRKRARTLVEGMKRMRDSVDNITYEKMCPASVGKEYMAMWVQKFSYPVISFCNVSLLWIEYEGISLFFHEISHWPKPFGMNTIDSQPYGYDYKYVLLWAKFNPEQAMRNASNIERFLAAIPPAPLPQNL